MSAQQTNKPDGVTVQKPRTNIYTMMMILAFFAIVIGCVLLYLELKTYGDFPWWEGKTSAPKPSAQVVVPVSTDVAAIRDIRFDPTAVRE